MDYNMSHVYRPVSTTARKRRRLNDDALDASLDIRKQTYQRLWNEQQQKINDITASSSSVVVGDIIDFLRLEAATTTTLPTGLVLTGHGSLSSSGLFRQITNCVQDVPDCAISTLTVADCPNLRTLLKNLISKTSQGIASVSYSDQADLDQRQQRTGLLNYDLQILYEWCSARNVSKVVLAIQDGEALDIALLTDLLALLKSWHDRLRFTLLLGIGTSAEIFQDRLPRAALKAMKGKLFNVTEAQNLLHELFESTICKGKRSLRLGPGLCETLIQRQEEHAPTIESFVQAVKYAYMSHFYANPLSVFLNSRLKLEHINEETFNAVRNLASFQSQVEGLLKQKKVGLVKKLLSSDKALHQYVLENIDSSQDRVTWILGSVTLVSWLCKAIGSVSQPPASSLYTKAVLGELASSNTVRELLMRIRKTSDPELLASMLSKVHDTLISMPPSDTDISPDDFGDILEQILPPGKNGDTESADGNPSLSSGYPDAQGLRLLAERFHDLLVSYMEQTSQHYKDIFLYEILFYDPKAPHRESFTPRPRQAIERALSSPQDYLGCACCTPTEDGLSASQPPVAILYQLYQESGALVNVHDLWRAFQAVVDGKDEREEQTMALFFRSLSELRSLGFVKHSKRRIDHVAKLAWKGL